MKGSGPRHPHTPPPSLKHPGRWLWLFLVVPVALGLTRLRFDVEVFDLLPSNLEAVEGLKLYQHYFSNARELILTVQGKSADQTEAAARSIAEHLRQHTNLVAGVTWEAPWLEHPDQVAELVAFLWFNQPPRVFDELANRLAPTKLSSTLAHTREELATTLSPEEIARLSYDPFGLTRLPESVAGAAPSFTQGQESFASSDGTFRIVFVQGRPRLATYRECERWLKAIRPVVASAVAGVPGGSTEVKIGYTGRPAFVAEVANGMERDITISVGGTATVIAILFWLAHRRVKPMLWLLALLAAILGCTLALGGLIYGTINVVSIGFAAILLGLAVDYAVVHYQEALAHPHLTIPQIRHAIAPSIFWAATTTIAAFLVLNFGGLPGLSQLGTLVGLGVALAASIMIFEFLPPLFPGRNEPRGVPASQLAEIDREALSTGTEPNAGAEPVIATPVRPTELRAAVIFAISGAVVLATILILLFGLPHVDATANALRPRNSPAYEAMDKIQAELNQKQQPIWLIIGGRTITNVTQRLDRVQDVLGHAVTNHLVAGFTLPTMLWPHPTFQTENRTTALHLASERDLLRQAAKTNGFSERALALTERVLNTWQVAAQTHGVFWPTNQVSEWIFQKLAVRTPTNYFAFGLVTPAASPGSTAHGSESSLSALKSELPTHEVWLSGWELLGSAIFNRVQDNMWKVVGPMIVLVLASLYFAFRRPPEIILSLAVLVLSGLCLLSVMRLVGWSWNLLDLMGIPLVLGTGVDYSIFMQLALRRYHGDQRVAYHSVGRALLLCGGTAIAAFTSLAFSSNAGMASLGQVCAVGIASNMLIAIFLLPVWWAAVRGRHRPPGSLTSVPAFGPAAAGPSSLYRSGFWRGGLFLVRVLPLKLSVRTARLLVNVYWFVAPHRRRVVMDNLLPAVDGDERVARKTAKAVFQQFAIKLIDLWRYEAKLPIDDLFGQTTGWEHFTQAQSEHRGVLLLTPHLGNWELGGPLLTRHGVTLQVITLAEPGADFTALRQASRARWNIETLVIGDDPLAFLEIIRRLESGATVALLVDRPPLATAVLVELFGQPFTASIAAAELARASGCVLLPVYIPRVNGAYEAHILPRIPYERATLRDRDTRKQLSQRVLRVFEPIIRRHLDQWYHFVPVWPDEGSPGPGTQPAEPP